MCLSWELGTRGWGLVTRDERTLSERRLTLVGRDRYDLDYRRKPRWLSARLRVRIPLRTGRLELFDGHAWRERHRFLTEAANKELVGRRRIEYELAVSLELLRVVGDEVVPHAG